MVRGYCERMTPTDDELAALFGLVVLRLCTSVCIAADQQAPAPRQRISRREPARDRARAADARGDSLRARRGGVPRGGGGTHRARVGSRGRLPRASAGDAAACSRIDPQQEPSIVLDLSVASPLIDGDSRNNAEPLLTRRVFDAMRQREREAVDRPLR